MHFESLCRFGLFGLRNVRRQNFRNTETLKFILKGYRSDYFHHRIAQEFDVKNFPDLQIVIKIIDLPTPSPKVCHAVAGSVPPNAPSITVLL